MTSMDRDHHSSSVKPKTEDDIAHRDAKPLAPTTFRYASQDEAMAAAELMMERYEDVLRELAK